ncbi:MAG: hypothetical protein KF685_08625 [Acidobacteria bacterium]|nr:hypothetical protein [Acidobacteriota bacterium]
MITSATGKRFIAAFFLAFFGLNLVGIFCLSHCNLGNVIAAAAAEKEHHGSSHCDPKPAAHREVKAESDNENNNAISGFDQCCNPGFGVVTATIKSAVDIAHAVPSQTQPSYDTPSYVLAKDRAEETVPVYRPPPKNGKIERKLNCVIRI